MSEFNHATWAEALTLLYARARIDLTFRQLCLTDPVAAVAEVSDIELPPELKFQFFAQRDDVVYPFLLPPVPAVGTDTDEQIEQVIHWKEFCTEATGTH